MAVPGGAPGKGAAPPGERPDAPRPQVRAKFVLQPGFEDRRLPRAQDGQLLRGDLAEPDVVAPTGKTGRGHASRIPGAEDSYAHTDRLKPEHPKPQGQAGRAFSCPRRRGAGPWFGVGSYEISRGLCESLGGALQRSRYAERQNDRGRTIDLR